MNGENEIVLQNEELPTFLSLLIDNEERLITDINLIRFIKESDTKLRIEIKTNIKPC